MKQQNDLTAKGLNEFNDWLLQDLVSVINKQPNAKINITILTHGFLISGSIVSGRNYYKSLDGFLNDSESPNHFEELGKQLYPINDETDKQDKPQFIHLADAKYYLPDAKPIPNNMGVFFRGRISEISGYTFGNLEFSAEEI